jgi:tungstate transport system ATP-binding protein
VLVVLGPSGSGKTTLLRCLALLLTPDAGEVRLDGAPARPGDPQAQRIALVGQKPLVFRAAAFDNVVYGLRARGRPEHEWHSAGRAAMERLGIWELRSVPARRLSGGEQQRVAVARALVLGPELLLLDEATANLDPANAAILEGVVRRSAALGTTIVASTHDLGFARRVADRVALLLGGKVVEEGPAKAFFEAPRTAETKAFLAGDLVG